ncbi:DUF1853 family protein [Alkalimarinus coralli]|uniref:DUF1853 family protein n=1 Tax=Alkalimarinus coralli TaxID=2935863 RepID=UPI00202AFE03|nr:DUF1853 family protein [Alkalimarinus coralli]
MQNKYIKDLAWAISSPSLVNEQPGWPNIVDTSKDTWVTQWLSSLDADPSPLQQHLAKEKSHFIGTYFESLWAFYLASNPQYELISRNLQVNSKARTVGEFDFILRDKVTGGFIHQEVAIKFYLGFNKQNIHEFSDGKHIWLGPQCRDRLDIKLAKMINHQAKLSETIQGKQALESIKIDVDTDKLTPQLVLKGYLFYPQTQPVTPPKFCNPNQLKGSWLTLNDFVEHIEKDSSDAWALLTKPEWISPFSSSIEHNQSNIFFKKPDILRTAREKVLNEQRPWMIAYLTESKGYYTEIHRQFIVPDDWPHLYDE